MIEDLLPSELDEIVDDLNKTETSGVRLEAMKSFIDSMFQDVFKPNWSDPFWNPTVTQMPVYDASDKLKYGMDFGLQVMKSRSPLSVLTT